MLRPIRVCALALTVVVAGACGGGDGLDLPPEAEPGYSLFRQRRCTSCHGGDAQGGVGPALQGVWGSDVALDDGTTVTATPEYLRRSITDPKAQVVDGYRLPMPPNTLTDDEVDSILIFLEAIGPTGKDGG